MSDRGAEIFRLVLTNPDFRLYKREDPENPDWCEDSKLLAEWGGKLLTKVEETPSDGAIAYAQWALEKQYWRLYHRVTDEHRRDERHATHPCLHRAYRELWERLDDLQMLTFPRDLMPPVQAAPGESVVVIESGEENTDPPVAKVSGIELGEFEEEDGGGEDDRQGAE
jgi:hypothetical protein